MSIEKICVAKVHTLEELQSEYSENVNQNSTIEPAFGNPDDIVVCLASSNEYAPFAGVVIYSILSNANPENNYDIVVLSDDMSAENGCRLRNMAQNRPNVSIRILDIAPIVAGFKFYTWAHFTPKTYYRMLVPDLFSNFDKVIYLDSDIVVNHDIADLYHLDIGDYLLGCCYDTHVVSYCTQVPPLEQREYNKTILKMENPEEYFQAGVSVYNVRRFHESVEKGYLINQGAQLKLRWLDQDVINLLLQGRIYRLPNKWNVMIANNLPDCDEYYLPEALRKEYVEARKDPWIVHYVGRAIPCYAKNPDMYEYFWHYARQTVFYEVLLQRMCEEATHRSGVDDETIQGLRVVVEQLQTIAYRKTLKGRIRWLVMPFVNLFFPEGSRTRNKIRMLHDRYRVAKANAKQ